MSKEIFISYRRADTAMTAGRLYDTLAARLGQKSVFKDIDNIPPGADFRKEIGKELLSAKVILLLIGDTYTTLKDENGVPRIKSTHDFVRDEASVALAYRHEKLVIPVFVKGAAPLKKEDLPPDLHELSFINGMPLSPDRWNDDVDNLVEAIKSKISPKRPKPPPRPRPKPSKDGRTILLLLGVLALIIAAAFLIPKLNPDIDPNPPGPEPVDINPLDFEGRVTTTQLNVRDAPGTSNSNVLMTLNVNDIVSVKGSRADDENKLWYLINIGGTQGWASSKYISLDSGVPDKPYTPPASLTFADRIKGKWLYAEYYRAGQSFASPYIGTTYDFQNGVVHASKFGNFTGSQPYTITADILTINNVVYRYNLYDYELQLNGFEYDEYGNAIPITMYLDRQ